MIHTVLGFILGLSFIASVAQAEGVVTGYKIPASGSRLIYNAAGNWYQVTNPGTKALFTPVKTLTEWNAFVANHPAGVTIIAATTPPSCNEILNTHLISDSGNYMIDPDGVGGAAAVMANCDMTTDGGGWTLLVNQNSSTGDFFASEADVPSKNTLDPSQNLYSILFLMENFRRSGNFTFKINWPGNASRNIWSQTTNPTIDQPVAGYVGITIDVTDNLWGGLERDTTYGVLPAFMDGSVGHSNWYYAIGTYSFWTIPNRLPGWTTPVPHVQLWVR